MREDSSATIEALNRATWSRPEVVRTFGTIDGWTGDRGERVLLGRVAAQARDQPILDLGVGAGRTVPSMLAISSDYVGLDYTLEMVAVARNRFPGVRIEHGDARDLHSFPDATFGFVQFSYNGIDAVEHDDRGRILREVRRVLRPGGAFGFSTHSLEHPHVGLAPWSLRRWAVGPRRLARQALHFRGAIRGYRRSARLVDRGDGWAMLVSPSHGFGIVIHHVTLQEALEELRAAGFADGTEVYDQDGQPLPGDVPASGTPWFHLLARAPLTAP